MNKEMVSECARSPSILGLPGVFLGVGISGLALVWAPLHKALLDRLDGLPFGGTFVNKGQIFRNLTHE
jgi:hypothetical protein